MAAARRAAAPRATPTPRVTRAWRPAVILRGGRRDGWSYFEEELERYRTIPSMAWVNDYQPTGQTRLHPENGGAQSAVWGYRPAGR
jgi:hypothetical protein